ncbi:MAG: PTS lactose/cellobiose transporter subunit IIA [Armatimonadetes bacterium]|nr:PTS lactose/cellobiose transporter subunit IIA [Armatimonadota bacterium]
MNEINWEDTALKLILHGGNARSEAFLALEAAKNKDYEKALIHLKNANEELKIAHEAQTKALQEEAQGIKSLPNLLMVHAHGHLMTAMSEKSLIEEMIELYKRLNHNEGQ